MSWNSYLANLRQSHLQWLAETADAGLVDQYLNLILAGRCERTQVFET
jgi:hypothetical protein